MPEIRFELSPDELGKLDTEVDLLGFADREAYLRWIVGNRAAIEQGTERDQLLTEYQSRVDELEAKLASREPTDASEDAVADATADADANVDADANATADGDAGGRWARATDGSGTTDTQANPGSGGASPSSEPASPEGTQARLDGTGGSSDATTQADGRSEDSRGEQEKDDDAWGASSIDVEQGGVPDADTAAEAADANAPTADAADVNEAAAVTAAREDLGGNFRPERVERFEDESLGSQANQLKGVEGERLDEFARRAVAKTRERLGREPSTGLDYRSQTRISRSSSDVRPGEDLVNLDELDVPGRSAETQAPRREAVGAALAYLRDVERAKRSDFVAELYEEYPAGYDTESSWWRCIKRGLKDARVVDGGDGSRVWTYEPPGSKEGQLVGSGPTRVVDPD
jgi:hypothetical protein